MKLGDVVWVVVDWDGNMCDDEEAVYADKQAAMANLIDHTDIAIPVRLVPVEEQSTPAPAPLPTPEEVAREVTNCVLNNALRLGENAVIEKVAEIIRTDRERRGAK